MLLQQMAGLLAGFFYKIYSSTYRYEVLFEDPSDKKSFYDDLNRSEARLGKNFIYACFHQDDLASIPFFSYKNICVLISNSKDGQILASVIEYLGYQTIRGSSHRGGVAGLLAGMRKVMEGHKLSIAVDGPRGPIYKVKDGITTISDKVKRPIVPLRTYPVRRFIFKKSWNKAALPMPFTKIVLKIGKINFYTSQELEDKMRSL